MTVAWAMTRRAPRTKAGAPARGWIDLSERLDPSTPRFPGDPAVSIRPVRRRSRGDPYNLSALRLGSHAGTHLDPPRHFFDRGTPVDRVDPERLIGPAVVLRIPPGRGTIGPESLAGVPPRTARLLLAPPGPRRTGRAGPAGRGLSLSAARRLLRLGVRLVGVEPLSVEHDPTERYPVHRALLGRGTVIVEGLRLAGLRPGRYELVCLPLRLADGDGAPCRAFARWVGPLPVSRVRPAGAGSGSRRRSGSRRGTGRTRASR